MFESHDAPPLTKPEEAAPDGKENVCRRATWGDYPALCQFALEAAVREGDQMEVPPEFPATYLEVFAMLENQIGWYVALKNQIVGVIFLAPAHQKNAPSQEFLEVSHLYVAPEYRAKGIVARALMSAAKRTATELNVPIQMKTNMGQNAKVLDRYMEKEGFKYLGGIFWLKPE
jgi:GNAT superfamily N-acetyltransferase